MGVYITGMEMPTSCSVCWALDDNGDYPRCRITQEQRGYNFPVREQRMGNCPLVPVPEHGDLIDRDSTIEKISHLSDEIDKKLGYEKSAPYITMALYLRNADDFPTIIPADKEGEG